MWRVRNLGYSGFVLHSWAALNLERSSSHSIDWSSEACDGHRLQVKTVKRCLKRSAMRDDTCSFFFLKGNSSARRGGLLWPNSCQQGRWEKQNLSASFKRKKMKGNLEFWLWNKMENEVIKKKIETTSDEWSLESFAGQAALCILLTPASGGSPIITWPVYVSWCHFYLILQTLCLRTTSEPLCQMLSNILSSTEEPILHPSMLWAESRGQMFKFIQRVQIHLCRFMLGAPNLPRPPDTYQLCKSPIINSWVCFAEHAVTNQRICEPLRTGVNVAQTQTGMRQESWVIQQVDRTDADMFLPASGCSCGQI